MNSVEAALLSTSSLSAGRWAPVNHEAISDWPGLSCCKARNQLLNVGDQRFIKQIQNIFKKLFLKPFITLLNYWQNF